MADRPKPHRGDKRRVERPAVGVSEETPQDTLHMPLIPANHAHKNIAPRPKEPESGLEILKSAAAGMSVVLGGIVLIVLFLAALALIAKGSYELFQIIFG